MLEQQQASLGGERSAIELVKTPMGGDVVGSGSALVFVAGVFAGSALWWWFLCGGVSLLRRRLRPRHLRGLDVLSGLAIAGFGLVAIGQGVGKLFVGNV